ANANRIVENSPTILYRIGTEDSLPLVYVSSNMELYGYRPSELMAEPGRWGELVHPEDFPGFMADISGLLAGERDQFRREFRWRRRDGVFVWFDTRLHALCDAKGRLVALEGILFDITERKVAGDKIAELARTDSLTTLPNRAAFVERLASAFAGIKRGGNPFAVIYLDLDNFKDVNDVLGHPAGDQLLQSVSERLKACVRANDLVARFGGDEFAVLQSDVGDSLAAATLADKIIEAVAAPYMLDSSEVHVTTSTGISLYSPDVSGPEAMMRQADLALYRAKEEGRGRFCFHSADLDKQVRERVTLADELRNAIKTGELELYYQPQVESASSRIVGLEALIRWNHPKRGMLSPGLFIPIAEKTGLILPLGRWVFEEACHQLRIWRDQGIETPTMSVNASAVQFKPTSDFEHEIMDAFAKWNIAPGDMEIELTESVLMEHTEKQNNVIERLRKAGVRIAIDDFGTGYSSLDYLSVYPITRLKIAQELISKSMDDTKNTAIVRAAITLARDLGVDVIAEGVETKAQLNFLAEAGCKNVQGYYYSTPVKVADATAMLRKGTVVGKTFAAAA
ncbi:MAG: putative bifunctional diguanylate cyclase/phosphodiesterase, partial [Alphaproteobacteria bacterium]